MGAFKGTRVPFPCTFLAVAAGMVSEVVDPDDRLRWTAKMSIHQHLATRTTADETPVKGPWFHQSTQKSDDLVNRPPSATTSRRDNREDNLQYVQSLGADPWGAEAIPRAVLT